MTKLTLDHVAANGYKSTTKQNSNADKIVTAVENTLSRDGTAPNYMEAVLDMNNNRVINVGEPLQSTDAVRLQDLMDAAGSGLTVDVVEAGAVDWPNITGKPSTFEPTVESVQDIVANELVAGSNVTISYNDTAGQITISSTGGGGGATLVDAVTDGDTTHAPTGNAVFDALTLKLDASAVTSSVTNGDTTHVPTSDAVYDAIAAAGGGGASVINSIADGDTTHAPSRNAVFDVLHLANADFVTHFGGVGNGSTNNDTFFALSEADTTVDKIYLPEGTYVTTYTRDTLKKKYVGPGRIKTSSTRWLSNFTNYDADTAYLGVTEYGQDSAVIKATDMEYHVVKDGLRKSATERYFYAPSTPKFAEMRQGGGWSGLSGTTVGSLTIASTSVNINGGVTGWNVGDTIWFVDSGGTFIESKVLTSAAGSTIGWSGGLSQSYPAGTNISHGIRTMNPYQFVLLDHRGGGDAYIWCGRIINSYVPLASQQSWLYTATVGLIGGDMTFSQNTQYGTGWEMQYIDSGKDVACIGFVNSYVRNNNTGAKDVIWIHDYVKGGGSKPIDGVWVVAGANVSQVGMNMSNASFALSNTAIALASTQRIDFNATTIYPGLGNSFIANTVGDSYIHRSLDGSSNFMEMWCGSYRLRLRDTGSLNFNGQLNISTAGNFGTDVAVPTSGRIYLNGLGGDTWIYYNGSTIDLVRGGVTRASF